MRFRVIPVIDLKGGIAVHAVGGRRDQYQPLRSVWQASGSPIDLAVAMCDGLGTDRLYLADLDAIEGGRPDCRLYERLVAEGITIWLDAGIVDRRHLAPLIDLDPALIRLVIGLETIKGPGELEEIVRRVGADRAIFSLDLDDGLPRIAKGALWLCGEPFGIASEAIDCGVRQILVLDLARVGTGGGVGTTELMLRLRMHHRGIALSAGGGIRGMHDLISASSFASSVLVGSALHDGRIGRRELDWFERHRKRFTLQIE